MTPTDRALAREVVAANASPVFLAEAQHLGFAVIESKQLASLGFAVARLEAPATTDVQSSIASLQARFPDVAIDVNHVYAPQGSFTLATTDFPKQAIHWPSVAGACKVSEKIGMIDGPVDSDSGGLTGTDIHIRDFSNQLSSPLADSHHGTAIATLLAGHSAASLLPGTPLYAANIFRQDAAGAPVATAVGFIEALNWMGQQGVTVVNVSLAGPPNNLMRQAVRRALDHGMQIVAAVGNDQLDGVERYPAAYPDVIGVTAVDERRAVLPEANRGTYVSFAAPGVDIWVPEGGVSAAGDQAAISGDYFTGTSFATTYVTATLAIVQRDVKRLRDTAEDLGAPGRDRIYGWGLVQAGPACLMTIGQK